MFRKLVAAVSLAAGLAVLAPSAASADTGYQYVNLGPGQSYCARDFATAYSFARGEGLVLSGHAVRFTFGTWSPFFYTVHDTGTPMTAWAAEAHSWSTPGFPGRFQACAINQSLKPSYVRLRAFGY